MLLWLLGVVQADEPLRLGDTHDSNPCADAMGSVVLEVSGSWHGLTPADDAAVTLVRGRVAQVQWSATRHEVLDALGEPVARYGATFTTQGGVFTDDETMFWTLNDAEFAYYNGVVDQIHFVHREVQLACRREVMDCSLPENPEEFLARRAASEGGGAYSAVAQSWQPTGYDPEPEKERWRRCWRERRVWPGPADWHPGHSRGGVARSMEDVLDAVGNTRREPDARAVAAEEYTADALFAADEAERQEKAEEEARYTEWLALPEEERGPPPRLHLLRLADEAAAAGRRRKARKLRAEAIRVPSG